MTMIDYSIRTGDIAATLPGLAQLLRGLGVTHCFGEARPLSELLPELGLAAAELETRSAALVANAAKDVPQATGTMIDYILRRYHDTHRRDLAELILLADKVENVHADDPGAPAGLATCLARIEAELESHMEKEEQILFPMMKSGGHPMIAQPIAAMMAEHDSHASQLARLEALTNAFTAPPDACGSWQALYNGLERLTADLVAHMHLENTVLFPRFL
ncbi:hemerythrin domain-containing protein [Roseinatronobacter alkalisoli]|uniref:Hemerythrin domain-containing protein n=1 Tax=Roseinatronobacter alkalisoli TaxID=3028235 RepID=A0ABT5TDS6_9RHOB|nr:hemerythrin domain-containing protein [Roseinatronobacter sp. HJB301]MDD7972317.1 hemerythrin domain-containing protein [Roseinatronobacter sp. HJB301]